MRGKLPGHSPRLNLECLKVRRDQKSQPFSCKGQRRATWQRLRLPPDPGGSLLNAFVPVPDNSLADRVTDLEVTLVWLTNELGLLSERLTQATQVEQILRRSRPGSINPVTGV